VQEVKDKVRHDIGAIASLAGATVVEQLPKTRSGKAMGPQDGIWIMKT
jgi:acyl-coenzyme A synthetase/AMP-(fatty) acid ligase